MLILETMHTRSLQQGFMFRTSGFFNALWPTLFWLVVMAIMLMIARPNWQMPDTAHKGQIMPPAPPPSTTMAQPCR